MYLTMKAGGGIVDGTVQAMVTRLRQPVQVMATRLRRPVQATQLTAPRRLRHQAGIQKVLEQTMGRLELAEARPAVSRLEEARQAARTSGRIGMMEIGIPSLIGDHQTMNALGNMSTGMETFPNGMVEERPENSTFGKSTSGVSLPESRKKNEDCACCKN